MGSLCFKPHTSSIDAPRSRRKTSVYTESLLGTAPEDSLRSPRCFATKRGTKKGKRARKQSETSQSERSRRHLIAELVKREELYNHSLNQLEEHFITPLCALDSNILSRDQGPKVFSNLGALVAFSRLFLEQLKDTRNVSQVFWDFVQYLQNFQFYVQQYHISLQTIDALQQSHEFQEYLDCVRNEYQLELMALLLAPIEQFCTYSRFLDLLSELTPPSHKEFSTLQDVLQCYAEVTAELQEVKSAVVNMTTILAVQNRMKGDFDSFVRPDRLFLCDGLLDQVSDSGVRNFSSRIVFLFSNLLLWSTDTYKFKGSVDLSRKRLEPHIDPQNGEILGIQVRLRQSTVVFLFRDAEQREVWMEAMTKTSSYQPPGSTPSAHHSVNTASPQQMYTNTTTPNTTPGNSHYQHTPQHVPANSANTTPAVSRNTSLASGTPVSRQNSGLHQHHDPHTSSQAYHPTSSSYAHTSHHTRAASGTHPVITQSHSLQLPNGSARPQSHSMRAGADSSSFRLGSSWSLVDARDASDSIPYIANDNSHNFPAPESDSMQTPLISKSNSLQATDKKSNQPSFFAQGRTGSSSLSGAPGHSNGVQDLRRHSYSSSHTRGGPSQKLRQTLQGGSPQLRPSQDPSRIQHTMVYAQAPHNIQKSRHSSIVVRDHPQQQFYDPSHSVQ